ncbi:MAG: ADP-ribosylglycohydrolase family protein [Aliishimia sp.]
MTQNSDILLGALIADAACLGLHWIYAPEKIAAIAERQGGQCAFTPLDIKNYEGVKTFAHGARSDGMMTQIGEVLRLTIQSMNAHDGAFDVSAYQTAFAGHFGAGGAYQGFMDRPTRGALENIAAEQSPSGIDDNQTPALSRLPAILVGYHGQENLADMVTASMEVTNVNDVAAAYSHTFTEVLSRVMQNEPLDEALNAAANSANALIKADLIAALAAPEHDSTEFAGLTGLMGRACSLPSAGPVIFHILKHSRSYQEAIERNILAGGDNAGRSIMIGAIMAGKHGVATPSGVPLSWVLKLDDAAEILAECEHLGA